MHRVDSLHAPEGPGRLIDLSSRLRLLALAAFTFMLVWAAGPLVAQASAFDIQFSKAANRSAPAALQGATVSGTIYAFVTPNNGATNVKFWLDNTAHTGTEMTNEASAPWDFAGTASDAQKTAKPYDTKKIVNGTHTITVVVTKTGGATEVVNAAFTVNNALTPPPPDGCSPAPCTFTVQYSASANRSSPALLDGKTVSNTIYAFALPGSGANSVKFWLDNPSRSGTPNQTEGGAPYDFKGTAGDGTSKPFDTKTLANGGHSITIEVAKISGGTEIATASFTIQNAGNPPPPPPGAVLQYSTQANRSSPAALDGKSVSGDIFAFVPNTGDIDQVRFFIDNPTGTGTPYRIEGGAPYDLAGTNGDGTAKPYNTLQLSNGSHQITAAVDRASGTTTSTATITVANGGGSCSPVPCSQVRVRLPYVLDWSEDHGGIKDKNNAGTGFTWIDRPSKGTGYIPNNLNVTGGKLNITTTKGLATRDVNTQDNGLAVGIDAPSQVSDIRTTIVNPTLPATGNYEQAGLFFGNDEKNYVKLVLLNSPTGVKINYYREENDVEMESLFSTALALNGQNVQLALLADPTNRQITARYKIGTGPESTLGVITAPGELFSFDAAGINPEIGTRSFGGIIASHRNGPSALTFAFDDFSVTKQSTAPSPGALQFTRTSFPVTTPTSMAWGPDGRLYVSEMFGKIHAISFGANGQVTGDQVITTLGSRLTLGITIDPLSTPSNVILWASHSNPSTSQGTANSGIVSRLSGPNLGTRQDVITGLPRAIANHATNSLHFGLDGKLYMAQGGNTGAGAANTAGTEFGTMAEQPLSAAILVADVRNANFDGTCNNTSDIFGPPPCDVQTYATGLRNTYDFVFHTNGQMYGPNNGLGVDGSFPPSPTPPCTGFGSTAAWNQGGNDPGPQPDPLNRLVQGKYYGHPNPTRNECVFGDGHYQGVAPLPNYMPPIANLGDNRSADGVIEYTGDGFCGELKNELLIANYSVGDDLTRVRLSADGTSVATATSAVGGFSDPLPVAQSPTGRIFVGELGLNQVTALDPVDIGCWQSKQPEPEPLLDAGGDALNGKLYVVGGKIGTGTHRTTVLTYDPSTNAWSSTAAPLPGVGVENPAVVATGGKLYVFGGSTEAFSGAVNNAAVYNPSTNAWTPLPGMATARGGATAKAVGNKIYVAGGMAADGSSLSSVEVLDTTTNTWGPAPASMSTRRDNPGSFVANGKLYVFGGRTRNADGSTPVAILNTTEMYDPATNSWTPKANMPTARRTMVVGTLNGRAQVMGGEIMPDGGAFPNNEEYDPATDTWRALKPMLTPRHGAAAGTINGAVYVAGGGPQGGFFLTDATEKFAFQSP